MRRDTALRDFPFCIRSILHLLPLRALALFKVPLTSCVAVMRRAVLTKRVKTASSCIPITAFALKNRGVLMASSVV